MFVVIASLLFLVSVSDGRARWDLPTYGTQAIHFALQNRSCADLSTAEADKAMQHVLHGLLIQFSIESPACLLARDPLACNSSPPSDFYDAQIQVRSKWPVLCPLASGYQLVLDLQEALNKSREYQLSSRALDEKQEKLNKKLMDAHRLGEKLIETNLLLLEGGAEYRRCIERTTELANMFLEGERRRSEKMKGRLQSVSAAAEEVQSAISKLRIGARKLKLEIDSVTASFTKPPPSPTLDLIWAYSSLAGVVITSPSSRKVYTLFNTCFLILVEILSTLSSGLVENGKEIWIEFSKWIARAFHLAFCIRTAFEIPIPNPRSAFRRCTSQSDVSPVADD